MRYAASWPQRAEKQRCPGRGQEKGSVASDSPAKLSEDWKVYLQASCRACAQGAWARRGMGNQKEARWRKCPPIHKYKAFTVKWIYMVFENDNKNHHVFCFALKSVILKLLVIENFMISFLYVYSTHCKSLSHIAIPFIHKIMFQCRVSIIYPVYK